MFSVKNGGRERFHIPLKLCQPIIELLGQSAEELFELLVAANIAGNI
jgi:hypothetical protein